MVRSFFGQSTPSRSRVHEPIIDSESFGNQGGNSPFDTRDVGKSANSNWFELARHNKEASESGRKPHSLPNDEGPSPPKYFFLEPPLPCRSMSGRPISSVP